MVRRLIIPILILLLVPALLVFAWLSATSTGVLSQQISGKNAKGKINTTCVYFFANGFKYEAISVTDTPCPQKIALNDLNAKPNDKEKMK